VYENRVMRRIFGSKRQEVLGSWRRLYNDNLQNLNASSNKVRVIKSRRIRWVGHVACMGEIINAYNILVGKPEGKSRLGRPRRRPENNIRIGLWETRLG
jgi:hypothetical protein